MATRSPSAFAPALYGRGRVDRCVSVDEFGLAWILAFCAAGFFDAWLFSSLLRLNRRWFVIPHVVLTSTLFVLFVEWSGTSVVRLFTFQWWWGVIAGVVIGTFLTLQVRSQPKSARPSGGWLAIDLSWLGAAYGIADGLLLSVLPVLAVSYALGGLGQENLESQTWYGAIALAATALVTVSYHLGFAEFRNPKAALPTIATGFGSLGFLITLNPLAAIVSHAAMHCAAVVRGPERTLQLPPHYLPA